MGAGYWRRRGILRVCNKYKILDLIIMNENTEYEKFVQDIYQTLIISQGVNTIEVKHDIKIEGMSGQRHQIDVYWEYEIADVKNRVAIECKNYNKEVSIGKVRDFYGVLADIGNINGIMVSKEGFQKGAKEYASHYGINLKEVRYPKDEDWKGRLKTIVADIRMIMPFIKERFLVADQEWAVNNLKLPKDNDFKVTISGMSNQIWLYDDKGNKLKTIQHLDSTLPNNSKIETDLTYTYNFEDAFIDVDTIGKLKINSIAYKYDIRIASQQLIINGEETAKAILKDALTGEIKFFDKDGTIK